MREFIVRKAKWVKENIILESKEYNIYKNYTPHEREIVFQIFFFFLGKQPIENKPYFYKSFSLTFFFKKKNIIKH